jgi:hypothetical protein
MLDFPLLFCPAIIVKGFTAIWCDPRSDLYPDTEIPVMPVSRCRRRPFVAKVTPVKKPVLYIFIGQANELT